MHTIFETEAFVLKSSATGEANKVLDILTKDFGFIRATAQGLRHLRSKLRYSLTDFSFVSISLIRGREVWRVTTATKKGDTLSEIKSRESRESLFRVFALLRRVLQGEEPNHELFDTIVSFFLFLSKNEESLSKELLLSSEEITVLRVLSLLGYVKDEKEFGNFLGNDLYSKDILEEVNFKRKLVVTEINRALQASHL